MAEKNYFNSEHKALQRSEIRFSDYNPRKITKEGKQALKRSIKKFGVVGGIVVNGANNNVIVGGHQKVAILDELYGYPENDYTLNVEVIEVDEKTEKELNITLNNPNVGGEWDYDQLRTLIPDIDYKDAGLTEADLSFIGVDHIFKTEKENEVFDELNDLMSDVNEEHQAEVEARKEQRRLENEASKMIDQADKIAHVKEVKAQVNARAQEEAGKMEAYVMISFDDFNAKASFMERFGYDAYDKFIKGEDFEERLEGGYEDEYDED